MSTETVYSTAEAAAKARREHMEKLDRTPSLIEVGEGLTMATSLGGLYTAYTVVAVRQGGRELDIQRDTVENVTPGGWADNGEKRYHPNPDGKIETVSKRKDGAYIVKGQPMMHYSTRGRVGYRRDWTDYSN